MAGNAHTNSHTKSSSSMQPAMPRPRACGEDASRRHATDVRLRTVLISGTRRPLSATPVPLSRHRHAHARARKPYALLVFTTADADGRAARCAVELTLAELAKLTATFEEVAAVLERV